MTLPIHHSAADSNPRRAPQPSPSSIHRGLELAAKRLARTVDSLAFAPPITHVYNPLQYAWSAHREYLARCRPDSLRVLFLGMNPGPWGMAQTGVPFGQVAAVRDWIGIETAITKPQSEHPKRPILGFACPRSEVSGQRLWGLFRDRFGTPDAFFERHFVINYCPLVFMESSGRNRTPDKLPLAERQPLDAACDGHLANLIEMLCPETVVGIGGFAETCLRRVLADQASPPGIVRILHPSPASPHANRDWANQATRQLTEAGVW